MGLSGVLRNHCHLVLLKLKMRLVCYIPLYRSQSQEWWIAIPSWQELTCVRYPSVYSQRRKYWVGGRVIDVVFKTLGWIADLFHLNSVPMSRGTVTFFQHIWKHLRHSYNFSITVLQCDKVTDPVKTMSKQNSGSH